MTSQQKGCTIYIIRHAESVQNSKGLIEGKGNSSLTNEGKKQALNLAKDLKHTKFDVIFSSDLIRAKKTAQIIAREHNLVVNTTEVIRERLFGKLEGKAGSSLQILANLQKKSDPSMYKRYGVESDQEVINRLLKFLLKVAFVYPGKKALVITHGSLLRVLLIHLNYATLDQLPPGSVSNTAFIKLISDGTDFLVKQIKGIPVTPILNQK